jgi:hypothetical protein
MAPYDCVITIKHTAVSIKCYGRIFSLNVFEAKYILNSKFHPTEGS